MDISSLGLPGKQSQDWDFHLLEGEILKGFRIRFGAVIDGITFIMARKNSNRVTTEVTIGGAGEQSEEVHFNIASKEYITQISGTSAIYSSRNDGRCITSMTIYTNLNQNGYGPYGRLGTKEGEHGVEQVTFFSTPPLSSNAIVGFYGCENQYEGGNRYLESIGVAINLAPIKFGPWGHLPDWSFMLEKRILKVIKISHGRVIDAIAFSAAHHGSMACESTYGGRGGNIAKIVLDTQRNEYLTQIRGVMGCYKDINCISSLTFYTNLKPEGYGPYGSEREGIDSGVKNVTPFLTPFVLHNGIVGFYGTANRYLESIGVFISPVGTSVGARVNTVKLKYEGSPK